MRKKPNILFYVGDHFRAESLGFLGNECGATPNLDLFSNETVNFNHTFCQIPICCPSRCSFYSGRYPHNGGYRTMHHLQTENNVNMLKVLKENGYYIYFGGKNDVYNENVPFETYCDYRSNVYKEFDLRLNGQPIPKFVSEALTKYSDEEIKKAAEAKKDAQMKDGKKSIHSFYQGFVDKNDALSAGNVGLDDAQIEDAIRFLKEYDGDKPICMFLSLLLPHPPYAISKEEFELIDRSKIKAPIRLSEEQLRRKPSMMQEMRENYNICSWTDEELLDFKQTFYASIHHLDDNFKKVADAFKEKGIYDDTAMFVFSDHGAYASEYECAEINANTFEDCLTNVPLMIKPQKGVEVKPRVCDSLVELVDISATVSELCDVDFKETTFGKSLVPMFTEDVELRDAVFCEGGRLESETHCTDDGHAYENMYWARTSVQERIPEHTKAVMCRTHDYKYVYRLYEEDEFYDLVNDPLEKENEINNPKFKGVINDMRLRMLDYFVETGDTVPTHYDIRNI